MTKHKQIHIEYNQEEDKFEIVKYHYGRIVMVTYKCKGDFVHYQILNDLKRYMEMGYILVGY